MKKRILALALAGTTAFSVFGAAISANAAWNWPSTDNYYNVDAYRSYTPVADNINVTAGTSATNTVAVDYNKSTPVVFKIDANAAENTTAGSLSFHSVYNYIRWQYDVTDEYAAQKGVSFTPSEKTVLSNTDEFTKVELVFATRKADGESYIRVKGNRDWAADGFTVSDVKGSYYVKGTSAPAPGQPLGKVYYTGAPSELFEVASNDTEYTLTKVNVADYAKALTFDNNGKVATNDLGVTNSVNAVGYLYNYKNGTYTYDQLVTELKKDYSTGYTFAEAAGYVKVDDATVEAGKESITTDAYNKLKTVEEYLSKIDVSSDTSVTGNRSIKVVDKNGKVWAKDTVASETVKDVQGYKYWTFNGDMTAEATVEPYKVVTTGTSSNLTVTKEDVPTIYAYDFFPVNAPANDAGTIAYSWNNESMEKAADAIGKANFTAENGRGVAGMGVRYEVVSEWIDFLDNLAINADNGGYVESEAEFIKNYTDMFYSDPVYDIWNGQQIGSINVDLYNIKGLLSDIYDLSARYADSYKGIVGWNQANTSEMVYLMQQYNKYIGNYFDKTEVEGTEWGELMLSVLNAVTEDNFKKASDYKKYMNRVDDLSDAYEEATTVGMIKEAEEGMYNLLTSVPYTAASVDKADLSATLNGLYFNAKSAPGVYSVAPSTVDASRATYTNYNYYVAVVDTDAKDNPYAFSTTLKAGYYSLYPMADYIDNDTTTPNSNYNGNVASADFNGKYATEEYEWFWNVYQLAVKMSGTNKYQGAVDAINEALNDAVSNLTVTTSPAAVDTGAMEDAVAKYEGKIDTDYNEGYYAKYTQANDYAENVAEGKWQTRIAAMITGVSGEALTYQGTQVTVTKNDMKTVEEAIKNGETALKAIKEDANYNAAQVNALNKAINEAQTIVDIYEGTYSTSKNNQSVNKVYTRLVGDKDQIVKSDLTAAIEAIDAAINYSEIVMGWSKNDAGKWQYGTEEGYLSNGWNKIGKTWFYFNADGTAKQSEWFQENGTWYWFNSNCGAATGWAKVDGEWYFFKGNNAMKTGWEKVDGNWYYMASSGKMVTGWCEVNGKWYYFSKASNSLGQMLYSTTVDGYKLGADGAWIK